MLICLMLAAWYVLAAMAGREEWLVSLPRPVLFAVPLALAFLALLGHAASASVRRLFAKKSVRFLIALHALRFLGVAFLISYGRMMLPGEIALPAGWGEIAIAAGAVALAILPESAATARLGRVWNWLGLANLLLILGLGFAWSFGNPARTLDFARTPVALHFLFVTPLAIALHAVIMQRYHAERGRTGQT